jgi:hypothetical protein
MERKACVRMMGLLQQDAFLYSRWRLDHSSEATWLPGCVLLDRQEKTFADKDLLAKPRLASPKGDK